jgi:hypothetical protein
VTSPVSRGRSLHILFLLHDSTYLRNFDDCIRSFLECGHTVTLAYPETKTGKQQKHLERKLFREGDVAVRFLPRARDDEWQALATEVRSSRNYLLYRRAAPTRASVVQDRVVGKTPAPVRTFLERSWIRRHPDVVESVCRVVESAIPAPVAATRFLCEIGPDVVLITPYVILSALYQVDYAKAARELGIPVAVPVFSWDNLTSKGVIQVCPDQLLVWNEAQLEEAVAFHGVPRARIAITGGMRFTKFFGACPTVSRAQFCDSVGLNADAPLITYLGSSRTIAPEEHEFLWRWIAAIRGAQDATLRSCSIFVRPHPTNLAIRTHWPAEPPPGVALWDGRGDDVSGVIRSVGNSDAVVGINTTAMLEAGALGKPVLTVLDDQLRGGQEDRFHFHHLTSVGGGLVTVASTLDQHVDHLTAILNGDCRFAEKSRHFADVFLKPPPPYDSAVSAFARAVERLARQRRRPRRSRMLSTAFLQPAIRYLARQRNHSNAARQ